MSKIGIFMADGCEEIEGLTVVDVVRRTKMEIVMLSITGKKEVTSSHGVTFLADALAEETGYEDLDGIVLPGGMPGTVNLGKSETVTKAAVHCAENGKITAAICAAPSVLGNLGILKGKKATCFPGFEKELEGATYTAAPVEIDGNVITGKGAGCAILFGKAIVEKAVSAEAANKVCGDMQCP